MDELLAAVAPFLVEGIIGIVTAVSSFVVAWIRAQTQRVVVQQVTDEVEVEGQIDPKLRGDAKRELAAKRATQRMNVLVRPSPKRMDTLINLAVPKSRTTIPPV